MMIRKILATGISLFFLSSLSISQDIRTLETKIADLLAQFPSNDIQYTDKLMGDMLALGEPGIRKICELVVPAGTGDDTKPRFGIETMSRFLSKQGKETEKVEWERICVSFVIPQKDPGVKDFFISQLQLIGGEISIEALKVYLTDKDNCYPALSAITAIGGRNAEQILAESLKNMNLPCAAAVMNTLAGMRSQIAVNEYIAWAGDANVNTKASAHNALACSGNMLAYPVLLKAAKSYKYRWERTGATTALLDFARNMGEAGDLKTMDRICKLVISKCNDKLTFQNKIAALGIYVRFHGMDAMPDLFKAATHPDKKYRSAAINLTSMISDEEVVDLWLDYFPKALPVAKPEIINMLGNRRDDKAIPLIKISLFDADPLVRASAAEAIAKMEEKNSVPDLIDYLMKSESDTDQEAAISALKSVSGDNEIVQLIPVLKEGSSRVKISAIELMAWNGNHRYFKEILPYASSTDESVKSAAIKALAALSEAENQKELITLLLQVENPDFIADLRNALAVAANKNPDPEKRSDLILEAMGSAADKGKLIPVLAKTGGRDALSIVLKEFENGNSGMREICFKALTAWRDYSASSALFEICASGNKTYEAQAFAGYVRQVRTAPVPDEQKLLLFRKIMPFALSAERKNELLTELGRLKTYQTLFFISNYLDDPATSATAAKSAMYTALPSVNTRAGMYGTNVREILTKAISKVAGQESEYDREMISKYLENMAAGKGFVSMFNGTDLKGWQVLKESGDFEIIADWKMSTAGDWNNFRIIRAGERFSIWQNGEQTSENALIQDFWERSYPIFPKGGIELQTQGTDLVFRDIYVREISEADYYLTPEEKSEGFVSIFNGRNLDNWTGNKESYAAEDGMIIIKPDKGSGGNLYTTKEYSDFVFRFEFQLTPGANNGLGIRAPLEGDAAYVGMELQILDNTAPVYAKLQPYQYHGSVYGVIPAKREFLKPVGEWNSEEVYITGTRIRITLNGTVIVDGDISGPRDNGTMDHNDHPGLKNKTGHIGFLGHGSVVRFRNIRIKELTENAEF